MAAVPVDLKQLDPLFSFLLHPRCSLVKLDISGDGKRLRRRCLVMMMHCCDAPIQSTALTPRARGRLHRCWRGTARCSILISAVSGMFGV